MIDLTAPVPGSASPAAVDDGEPPSRLDPPGVAGFDQDATTALGGPARRTTRPADARWAGDAFDPGVAAPEGAEPRRAETTTETGLPPIQWQPVPPAAPATVVRRCPTCDARVRVPAQAERCGAGHRLSPAHAKRRWRLLGRRSATRP